MKGLALTLILTVLGHLAQAQGPTNIAWAQLSDAERIRSYTGRNYDFHDPRLNTCHLCYSNIPTSATALDVRMDDLQTRISIINPQQLQTIFQEMRSGEGLGQGINSNVIADGCLQRAHLFNQRLAARGILTGKVYATGNSGVLFHDENGTLQSFNWGFHVAPTVFVRFGNRVQLMVLDPNLMNSPATIAQWLQRQNQNGDQTFDNLYFTSANSYALNSQLQLPNLLDQRFAGTQRDAAEYLASVQGDSPESFAEYGDSAPSSVATQTLQSTTSF